MLTVLAFSLHIRAEKGRRAPTALLGEQVGGFLMAAPVWLPLLQQGTGLQESY